MALEINLRGDILEVIERIMGFHDTRTTYWYYNIRCWKQSTNGKKDETAGSPMTAGAIKWVTDHYLSKVKKPNNAPISRAQTGVSPTTKGKHNGRK